MFNDMCLDPPSPHLILHGHEQLALIMLLISNDLVMHNSSCITLKYTHSLAYPLLVLCLLLSLLLSKSIDTTRGLNTGHHQSLVPPTYPMTNSQRPIQFRACIEYGHSRIAPSTGFDHVTSDCVRRFIHCLTDSL